MSGVVCSSRTGTSTSTSKLWRCDGPGLDWAGFQSGWPWERERKKGSKSCRSCSGQDLFFPSVACFPVLLYGDDPRSGGVGQMACATGCRFAWPGSLRGSIKERQRQRRDKEETKKRQRDRQRDRATVHTGQQQEMPVPNLATQGMLFLCSIK
jgi:hypothetical protein